jgi:hypothetical protein
MFEHLYDRAWNGSMSLSPAVGETTYQLPWNPKPWRFGVAGSTTMAEGRNRVEQVADVASPAIADVFARLIDIKVAYSQLAMHLSTDLKKYYFARLDAIADFEEWDGADALPKVESFQDFLRTYILYNHSWRPQLALNSDGIFAACWYKGDFRLTWEFLSNQQVRYIMFRPDGGKAETATGDCHIKRLKNYLEDATSGTGIF